MSTLVKKSQELMRSFRPDPVEDVQGFVVTFYIGQSEDQPIDFAYVAPVSWERRVEAKDSFESLLRKFGRMVIGSVILGIDEDAIPTNDEEAVARIYEMVPENVPYQMLRKAVKARGVH